MPAGRPPILPFATLGFLISGTAYLLANLFPVLATEYAGLSEAQAGSIYALAAVVTLSGPLWGWLSDHVSRRLVLSMRSLANVGSSVLYLVAPGYAGLATGKALDDAGKAAFRPAWGSVMAEVASFDRSRRARVMGYLSVGEDAGEVVGPIAAGLLWSAFGVPAVLVTRIVLAVATEVYAVRLSRRFDDDRHPGPTADTAGSEPPGPAPVRLPVLVGASWGNWREGYESGVGSRNR